MTTKSNSVAMPELTVFARAIGIGLILTEIFRLTYIGATSLYAQVSHYSPILLVFIEVAVLMLLAWYAFSRGLVDNASRLLKSWRLDLLLSIILGAWVNFLILPLLQNFHNRVENLNPLWTLCLAGFLLLMISSSLARAFFARRNTYAPQMHYLNDVEIQNDAEDFLAHKEQAIQFAKTLLTGASNGGLVFGIDAPWGTGKTSFINLASNYWQENAANEVIVFRFEPLRYASDPDLSERFIRDLSAEIQRQVFVPEFPSTVTRYSRMLKGKTDFSFLGFKFTLEPSMETIDELLTDIDDVLKRLRRRLIVVIDDLDRLDSKAINNVLFTVQRTFRLSQATYILCYDTEILIEGKEDGDRGRRFLEKFINLKLSLFIDSSALVKFLRTDWSKNGNKYQAISSDTMLKVASVVNELANMLEKDNASIYMSLIGDVRKLKRFVNAVLVMQIDKQDLSRTDFNPQDLINLILLYLNYPGIFRKIYAEETEGRSGIFSAKVNRTANSSHYANADGYIEYSKKQGDLAKFLLDNLFEVDALALGQPENISEKVSRARACFNSNNIRNLENYLTLIVRLAAPEPRLTFRLYQDAMERFLKGTAVAEVLSGADFSLKNGEHAHDQFWRILVSQSYDFTKREAEDSINTLVDYLPKYSVVNVGDRGLRNLSIYNLIRLLDKAGWGRTAGQRRNNTPENIIEIADRIYGEKSHAGMGLIDRLSANERGVLGLHDLILFRLQCSADRQGQIFNVHNALVLHDDRKASTAGLVSELAIAGMRTLSQRVFAIFQERYIDNQKNLFDELDAVPDINFIGETADFYYSEMNRNEGAQVPISPIEAARSNQKSFIVYQLVNQQAGTGAGVGIGYYDVVGNSDSGGIASQINDYLFDICFNPTLNIKNVEHFLTFCLFRLTNDFFTGDGAGQYVATKEGLIGELDERKFKVYWEMYGDIIKGTNLHTADKKVFTLNYTACYSEELPRVFEILDSIP